MNAIYRALLAPVFAALCLGQEKAAPQNELAFSIGALTKSVHSGILSLDLDSGLALGVNYGGRLVNGRLVASATQ